MTTDALTSGSGTYTVGDGVYAVTVRRWGAGGSGGGTGAVIGWNGAGGGSGEFLSDTFAVTPGQQFAYSVGAGGPRKINALGIKGGDTTFGSLSPAHGGLGGICQQSSNAVGALGGTGGSADIQRDGGQGGSGTLNSNGGGGAAPGDTDHAAVPGSGRTGATGPVSTGGLGGNSSSPNGADGTAPGAGGGGAYSNTAANRQSGAGADGRIEVEYTSTIPGEPSLDAGAAGVSTGAAALTRTVTIPSGAATQAGGGARQWMADSTDLDGMYRASARVGAVLNAANMFQPSQAQAQIDWQEWTGHPVGIVRRYFAQSSFPQSDADLTLAITNGVKVAINLCPAYNPTSATDRTNMAAMLAHWKGLGLDAEISLWAEPYYNGLTALQFTTMWAYYYQTIRDAGYAAVFCTSARSVTNNSENSYYPGDAQVDKITTDMYANGYADGIRLDLAASIADAASPRKPFGLWEYNGQPLGANFLKADAARFKSTIAHYTGAGNCGMTWQSAPVYEDGYGVARLASLAAGTMTGAHCSQAQTYGDYGMKCAPGDQITVSMWVQADAAGHARTVQVGAGFYTSGGAFVSNVFATATGITDSTTWQQVTGTVTVPSSPGTPAFCRAMVTVLSTGGANEYHYIANVAMSSNALGQTEQQVTDFFHYVRDYFAARVTAGKPNADLILFNSGSEGAYNNESVSLIIDESDYRIALQVDLYNAVDAVRVRQFFGGVNGYALGTSPGSDPDQDTLGCNAVARYASYASFAADLSSGALNTGIYGWALYDPDYSEWTPQAESEDPWSFMASFANLAHASGLKVILAPARGLGDCPTSLQPRNEGESPGDWYLRVGIATAAAEAGAEVYEVQDQANTLVDGAPPYTTFAAWFNSCKAQARAVSQDVQVWCGVSADYGTAAQMEAAAAAVDADGYWVMTAGDIPKAAAFLDLAAGMAARPAGTIAAGVFVGIWCACGTAATTWSCPGFTAVSAVSGTSVAAQLLYKITDGTEGWVPGTTTVTVTANASRPFNCEVFSSSDSHLTTPMDPAPSVSGQANALSQAVSVASITTTASPDLGIWLGMTDGTVSGGDAPPAITVPSGWGAVGSQVNSTATGAATNVGTRLATKSLSSAGTQGAANGSIAGGVNKYTGGMFLALRAPATPPAPPAAARCGAFISPTLFAGDEAAGVADFVTTTGRSLGIRAHSYSQGVIPANYATDLPDGGVPPANTVTVTNPGTQSGNVGKPVTVQMAGTDSDAAETLHWTASGLPAGLVISDSGLVTGSPTTQQTRSVTVTATDSTGASGTASFSWVISPPVVTGGYGFGGASVDNRTTGDAKLASWERIMGRALRERMYFQQASFPSNYSSLPYAGDKNVPRRMHIDVEPASDGSQVAAFKAYLQALKSNGADVTFRLYHSMHSKFSTASAFKTAYAYYGPLIRQYGFRLQLSFVNYQLTHGQVDGTWVPSGIDFDAITVEWYAHQHAFFGDRLTEALAIAHAHNLPLGMCEYGANIAATIGDDLHVSEAQGIAFFQYCRDTLAAEIRANRAIAECLSWNNESGAGRVTPGYEIENQPASWVTWYQRIYDLVTRSSPGNPYIW